MASHGFTDADLFQGHEDERFQSVMRDVVARARTLFVEGLPLPGLVDRRLAVDLELFSRGGLLVLDKIERQEYRVLRARPSIGKLERVGLLLGTLARVAFGKAA